MTTKFYKNGNIRAGQIIESNYGDLLAGDRIKQYTASNPYILTGTSHDIITVISGKVAIPTNVGNIFYLCAKCAPEWAAHHGYSTATAGKCTIWYYLDNTASNNLYSYDQPICYNASNWIKEGVWRTTIDPNIYKTLSIRVNTYSDGTNSVTTKFWDIKIIPEKYYIDQSISSGKIYDDKIVFNELIEY